MNTAPELTTPLTPARPQGLSAAADSDQARAVAEVQAQMIMAKRFPRNEIQARDKILNACMRKGLAEVASYDFARGGSKVTGPSIRLLEVMAASWGNMVTGWRELSRQNGVSEIEAYAWDLESNTRWPLTFQVKHWRDTKGGGYQLTDERDIYELCANMAARRVRACIEKLIPGDIIDDAVAQCEQTLLSKANVTPEHIKRTVEAFMQYNVTPEMIEVKIQRRIDSITAPQVVQLGKIFNSLRDGMSKPEDWFDMSAAKKDAVEAKGTPEPTKKPAKSKADPVTGEVIDQAATDSSPPKEEVKPTDPKPAALPVFDINAHNLNTAPGVKAASAELIAVLGAYPPEERPGVFLGSSGVMVVEGMRAQGLALDIKKIEALGISLPPVEDSGNASKIPFKKKEGGAA